MITAFTDFAAMPDDAAALLAAAEREDFQFGAAWFGTLATHALPAGATPLLLLYRDEPGRAVALLPLRREADGRLGGLASPYTTRFRPAVAAGADPAALRRAFRAFGRFCRGAGPLRLEALEEDWPGLPSLRAGLRGAGLVPLRFAHFGNWHAEVGGLGWAGYLAGRPGALRETIRRRLARLQRLSGGADAVEFSLVTGGADLATASDAYAQVQARSWKLAEPYPGFGPAFLRAAAAAGVLRLGVLRQGGAPVAAQYWTVSAGTATVHKLAHDEAARALSPGTLLTALMLRHLLDHEAVRAIDFGRGDDPYKQGWTGQRRQRIGVLACPPWQRAGLVAIGRHALGQIRRRFVAGSDIGKVSHAQPQTG